MTRRHHHLEPVERRRPTSTRAADRRCHHYCPSGSRQLHTLNQAFAEADRYVELLFALPGITKHSMARGQEPPDADRVIEALRQLSGLIRERGERTVDVEAVALSCALDRVAEQYDTELFLIRVRSDSRGG